MMIHDQLLSTQLLMNVKNEHSSILLNSPPTHSFHGHSSSVGALNMDLYSAYAFQAHLQQRQHQEQQQKQQLFKESPEVLDLSRRCDSVETPRKTPSPYQTNSSTTGTPPLLSPTNSNGKSKYAPNMLGNQGFLSNTQSLYPMLYFPHNMQTELGSNAASTTAENLPENTATTLPPSTLLQTFASMAAGAQQPAISIKSDSSEIHKLNTPTTKNEIKNTRPFKAFPRDPLVIAANFAATDVLLDNPHVERYTEYRKRVLQQIRNSNGGSRTVTNPKMRRTNSRSNCISEGVSNNLLHSENEGTVDEYSDCESNAGNFERISHSMNSSTSSIDIDSNNNNNGSVCTTTNVDNQNHNKTNSPSSSSYGTIKDAAYYERRRKNNAAAKKSRDRRRIKEDEIAIRAAYLERQNIELLCQIDALKSQLAAYTSKMVGV